MKKQILEELSYMKYISNYKKGRVISEQDYQTVGNQCKSPDDCNEDENCFNGYCVPKILTSSGTYGQCKVDSDCGVGFMCKDSKCTVDTNSGYWDKTGAKPNATGSDPIYTGPGGSEFHTGWDEGEDTPTKPNPKLTGSTEVQKEYYINRLIKNILSEQDYQTIGNQCQSPDDCNQDENCFNGYCVPKILTSSGTYGECKVNSDCGVGFMCKDSKCTVDTNSGYWDKTGAKPSATGSDPIYTGPGGSEFHTGWNEGEDTPTKPNPKLTGSTEVQKEYYINRLIKNILSEQVQTVGTQCSDKDDCPENYNCFNGYCVPKILTTSGTYGSCKQTSDCGVGYKCENLKCVVDLKSGYWEETGSKPSATGSDPIYTGPGGSEFHTGWNEGEETPPKPTSNPIKK